MRLARCRAVLVLAIALLVLMATAAVASAAPVIVADVEQSVVLGQAGGFDATGMMASDAGLTLHWDFGDGTFVDAARAQHTFPEAGTYQVTLRATSTSGEVSQQTWSVNVSGSSASNYAAAASLIHEVADRVANTPDIRQPGQRQRLLVNLQAAIDALAAGDSGTALDELQIFLGKLDRKIEPQPGATYSATDAAAWRTLVGSAVDRINAPAGQNPAGIAGTIAANLYERSVPGATVTVYVLDADGVWAPLVSTLADASGRYRVALVDGTYRVGAIAAGFTPAFHTGASSVSEATDVRVLGPADTEAGIALDPIQRGTEEFPYLVYDMQTLDSVRQHKSAYWRQIRDVDAVETGIAGSPWYRNGAGWLPIGSEVYPDESSFFYGTYDGGGFSIRNLKIVSEWGPQYLQCVGLFRGVYGTVKNVNLLDADVRVVASPRMPWVFGGLLSGALRGTVVDSTVTGHLSGYGYYIGGVTGEASSAYIRNVSVDVSVTPDGDRMQYLGGIAGGFAGIENNSVVRDCRVNFVVSDANRIVSHVGPIAGQAGWTTVENCQTTGSITAPLLYRSGGLVGIIADCTFRDCTASVQSTAVPTGYALGGLFGTTRRANVIENCVNTSTLPDIGWDPWP